MLVKRSGLGNENVGGRGKYSAKTKSLGRSHGVRPLRP